MDIISFFEKYKEIDISFQSRAEKLNPKSIILWRVATLSIFLSYCCKASRSSLSKLQIFYSCVERINSLEQLVMALNMDSDFYSSDLRFDPTLIRVLNYMISWELIEREGNSRFKLTTLGKDFAEKIKNEEVLLEFKNVLFSVPKSTYSEARFNKVFSEAL